MYFVREDDELIMLMYKQYRINDVKHTEKQMFLFLILPELDQKR